ncbi:MAG TPA: IS1380 family transposase [Acidisarcina sp.]
MPTDCNSQSIHFTPLKSRQLLAQFDGGSITSDAGALLLREVAGRSKLFARMAAALPDPRDPDLIEHDQQTMLAQRVLGIACGWEDLNDHHGLRIDPLMQVASEQEADADHPLASPATLCRLENRVNRGGCVALSRLLVDLFIESFDEPPAELILDFDATDDPIHGEQEGRFFHGYYDSYCYLPLYVFCGEKLLVSYLRPSNIDAAKHSRAILKLLVLRLRQVWPGVKIIFRGDSGFCRWKLMRWCDRHGVDYVIGLARNKVLERMAQPFMATAQLQYEQTAQKQRIFADLSYAAGSWDKARRVIHKAEHNSQGDNPRFIVTSLEGDPQQLYDQIYCARGEMENRIKEQQLGLFAGRTSCQKFVANQFRLLLSSYAYVLIETLRRTALAGTELAKAQATTIRIKLLKIGAVVIASVRRIVLRLSSAYPLKTLFARVARQLLPHLQTE